VTALLVLTGFAVAYALSNAPRVVYLTAPTLGTRADAQALDVIVRHTMGASSFTEQGDGETLTYQAPDRIKDVHAFENTPSSSATTITIGSVEYNLLGQPLGQPGCWGESQISAQHPSFDQHPAMENLMALLGYPTALRRGTTFTIEKVVPATLLSVTRLVSTVLVNPKQFKAAVNSQRAVESSLQSKGLLRITTTVTTRGGDVVGLAIVKQGTFVTTSNKVVSGELTLAYTYSRFNSSPPIQTPPASDVLNTATNAPGNGGGSYDLGTCTFSVGIFPVNGVTTAVQNQYLALSQPLNAANVAFVTAVIPHYQTTLNSDAKRLPLVAALTKANMELADDAWPAGLQPSISSLIGARKTFIADIVDLPSTGYVTSAWTKKLYNDGAKAGTVDSTIQQDLGIPGV
jgi:hypothetical protein